MARVPSAPVPGRSYDGDRREILSEIGRLDRQKPPLNPGSVQSTDGSTIRIPGPLNDTGRGGKVLTWDEDLHQPTWQSGGGGISAATRCEAWDYVHDSFGSAHTMQGIDWHMSSLGGDLAVSAGADPNAVYVPAAGWYMATFHYNVSWTSIPTNLAANITWAGDDPDFSTDLKPIYTVMGSVFAQSRLTFHTRWVSLPAGGWFRASLGWDGSAGIGSFHHFAIDVTKG